MAVHLLHEKLPPWKVGWQTSISNASLLQHLLGIVDYPASGGNHDTVHYSKDLPQELPTLAGTCKVEACVCTPRGNFRIPNAARFSYARVNVLSPIDQISHP